jgi:hypothetical protein
MARPSFDSDWAHARRERFGRVVKAGPEARRFHAKATAETSAKAGTWNYCLVTIFDGDAEIGSYRRNYPSFAEETFEPFELDGSWYALYSRDYTSTRVMKLPECLDLGGEAPNAAGFAPPSSSYPVIAK